MNAYISEKHSERVAIKHEGCYNPGGDNAGKQARSTGLKTEESLSATVEEYLETVYNMSAEDEVVIGARLAEKFRVSAPTVTEMLKRLVRDGYITMDSKRVVTLTEAGYSAAEAVLRRHRLTERFLVDMLGMQWHQVHEEAHRVVASLHHPTTCPHGNPIPGLVPSARTYLKDQGAQRLSTIGVGQQATILCISEVVEDEEALILHLHEKGLTPETRLTVLINDVPDETEEEENFCLRVDGRAVRISEAVAAKIWVTVL
jgi:DtxR family transcriptional regulator, Mn-dependent transcriptional regulator